MKFCKYVPFVLALLVFCLQVRAGNASNDNASRLNQPEIEALRSAKQIEQQRAAVRALVSRMGPEAAQDELFASGLPFTGVSHLIVHTVGSMIYKQFGVQGISYCRSYFLGACFHGFLIDAISERGPAVIQDIWPECQKAGPAVPDQCAHAVGHGLLAWHKYSLSDALVACDSIGARVRELTVFNCYDGVFMEKVWRISGHVHTAPQLETVRDLDYPCDDPQLQPKHLTACWGNQASVLYQVFHGDLSRVATKCASLINPASEEFCFNGLARQIHPLTNGDADEAFRLCAKIRSGHWQDYCLITVAGAAFSVGDQINMPFTICNHIRDGARTSCYQRLFPLIRLYARDSVERADELCGRIKEQQSAVACMKYQRTLLTDASNDHMMADPTMKSALKSKHKSELGSQPNNGSDQLGVAGFYCTPYETPYTSPYLSPYLTPYLSPYLTPYLTPYETPPP